MSELSQDGIKVLLQEVSSGDRWGGISRGEFKGRKGYSREVRRAFFLFIDCGKGVGRRRMSGITGWERNNSLTEIGYACCGEDIVIVIVIVADTDIDIRSFCFL
jgi:hypothetical protein